MLNYLLYLNYQKFNFLNNLFNIEHLKDLAVILTGLGSVATIILVAFSYKQFKIFIEEYKEKHSPHIIPYLDTINDGKTKLIVLKFYNNSNIVAQNICIKINEEWLNQLSYLNKNYIKNSESLRRLSSCNNIYITNKQEYSYLICSKLDYSKLSKIPLEIKIIYYNKNNNEKSSETFIINMESISGKLSNPSEHTRNKINEIKELKFINQTLKDIKMIHKDEYKKVYKDLLKIKLEEYYITFNELYPYIDVADLYYEELIEDIDKCLKTKTKTNIVEESDVRNRFK